MQDNKNYLFVKRFTAKEEPRRLQCGVYLAKRFPQYQKISTQNKINFVDGVLTAVSYTHLDVGEIKGDKIYDYTVVVSDEQGFIKNALITLVVDDNAVLVCLPDGKVIDYYNQMCIRDSLSGLSRRRKNEAALN